jgi:hypothetical protein
LQRTHPLRAVRAHLGHFGGVRSVELYRFLGLCAGIAANKFAERRLNGQVGFLY